jgi:hypothetical protein
VFRMRSGSVNHSTVTLSHGMLFHSEAVYNFPTCHNVTYCKYCHSDRLSDTAINTCCKVQSCFSCLRKADAIS